MSQLPRSPRTLAVQAIVSSLLLFTAGCPRASRLQLSTAIRTCPQAIGFSVQPLQQELGMDIQLVGQNQDAGPENLRFQWSQSQAHGLFVEPKRADTQFTCKSVGTTTLSLLVTDLNGCNYSSSAQVRCVPVQLCGNQQLDPGEACDGRLGPFGALTDSQGCARDCKSILDLCALCEQDNCRDFRGQGVDLVAKCLEDRDPKLVQRCQAIVSCARKQQCAYGTAGTAACYCGHANDSDCQLGKGIDGPCRAEVENGAGSKLPSLILNNLGNLNLALGRASMFLECDRVFCPTTCAP